MTKKQLMYEMIEKHGANLNEIFKTGYDNISLAKKLMRLETKAHRLATDFCNGQDNLGNSIDCSNIDYLEAKTLDKVCDILNIDKDNTCPIFINIDCRGYALKIHDIYVKEHNLEVYKDWGGYGILAPDFREEI